jgi:hypothetical protein
LICYLLADIMNPSIISYSTFQNDCNKQLTFCDEYTDCTNKIKISIELLIKYISLCCNQDFELHHVFLLNLNQTF